MAYLHGIYVQETPTAVVAPIVSDSAVQVAVGAAPINMGDISTAMVPKIAFSRSEAIAKVGYSNDFASFDLMQSLKASFEMYSVCPVVFINVLDPTKHTKQVADGTAEVFLGKAVVAVEGILRASVTVKLPEGAEALENGKDYTLSHDDNGYLVIKAVAGGLITEAVKSLSVAYTMLDAALVTEQDIINGLQKVKEVYPRFGVVPGIILAPKWSSKVAVYNAMTALTEKLNGTFSCVAIAEIDTATAKTYDAVAAKKETDSMTHRNSIICWPMYSVGGKAFSSAAVAGAHMAHVDVLNEGVPYVSPSNKAMRISGICLADGTEVILDQEQGNMLNAQGVCTAINMNGWRFWGNRTACYPGVTDIKDSFIPARRMFNWWGNTFILTYFQEVDNPMNKRLIEKVVDSENIRAGGFKSRQQIADARIEFRSEDNPDTDLLNGHLRFKQYLTVFPPAEAIINDMEYDVEALSAALK